MNRKDRVTCKVDIIDYSVSSEQGEVGAVRGKGRVWEKGEEKREREKKSGEKIKIKI
jgi:hypothetical protein